MIEQEDGHILTKIEEKLDKISERLARIEGALERHDERSVSHHERIVLLEMGQRKATWALAGAALSVLIAILPLIAKVL